jgi:uncharacterized tellurite resistance protein B-like protein
MSQDLSMFDDARLGALAEVLYLAATADGEFADDERAHFRASVESLTDRRLEGPALDELVARISGEVEREGRDARARGLAARLGDEASRKVALSMAIRLMSTDGILRTSERELILDLAESLSIEREQAADLVVELGPAAT